MTAASHGDIIGVTELHHVAFFSWTAVNGWILTFSVQTIWGNGALLFLIGESNGASNYHFFFNVRWPQILGLRLCWCCCFKPARDLWLLSVNWLAKVCDGIFDLLERTLNLEYGRLPIMLNMDYLKGEEHAHIWRNWALGSTFEVLVFTDSMHMRPGCQFSYSNWFFIIF